MAAAGGAFVVSPYVFVGWVGGGGGGNVPGARKNLLLASVAFDWFGDDQVVRIEGSCVCGPLSMLECDVAAVEVAVVMRSLDVDAAVAAADSAQALPLPHPGS